MNPLSKKLSIVAVVFLSALISSCQTNHKKQTTDYDAKKEAVFFPIEKSVKPEQKKKEKPFVVSLPEHHKPKEITEEEKNTPISINFKKARLESVVNMLSDNGKNFNYIIHPSARGRWVRGFTMENVSWREAMNVLLKLHDLKMVEEKGLVIIITYDAYMESLKRQSELMKVEQKHAEIESSFLETSLKAREARGAGEKAFKTFTLKYTDPVEVVAYMEQIFNNADATFTNKTNAQNKAKSTKANASNINFSIFPKSSLLTVFGTPKQLREVEERLVEIDVPQQQVFIESRIVELLRSSALSLGIQWGGHHIGNSSGKISTLIGGVDDTPVSTITTGTTTTTGTTGSNLGGLNSAISFPATDPTGGGSFPAAVSVSLGNALGTSTLNARLSALEKSGKSKTVSNPKVSTINGVTAKIESGREIPYQSSSGGSSGATTVAFKHAVLSLEVTPLVTEGDRVSMKIVAKKDAADFTNEVLGTPSILTRTIETNVMVDSGGTAVLGGVFEKSGVKTSSGVPLLSRVPLLGWLFKGETNLTENKELLIFVTPTVIERKRHEKVT